MLADATARALQKNHAIKIEREGIAAADARAMSALATTIRSFVSRYRAVIGGC